ncbi:MAG: hypothetical protein MO852_04485 [Candidatus Devosia euplotis]|nr:hypothetical protein [Candidatus Devosia euplotis]
MQQARAAIILKSPERHCRTGRLRRQQCAPLVAVTALNMLTTAQASAPAEVQPAIAATLEGLARDQAAWDIVQNIWFGVSLGSVLLLAAIGLAITFGVMA